MAKKFSILNFVTTKVGILTAVLVVIFGAIFLRSTYELVRMFLLDMMMSFGITNDYWQEAILAVFAVVVIFFIARDKLKNGLK